ncbi:hypothetical protein CPB83DRAFT_846283 [Crepidotus variabilis]|uniref:Uncharacterized protein n=1 Tax=Crepidotus variabilis TaxID=179855 RepID=A0A9P6EQC8_9AGAR|nr:hypothetical protein CPB83DRAFT_846283 [Crepidotus variabilis]
MESQPVEDVPVDDEVEHEEHQSRHSSILGPYRKQVPFTQFPIYHPTTISAYQPAVFSRSLMSTGYGFAPWQPGANERPETHFHQGMSIGDVGFIGSDGALHYRFNIFHPSDHPIQPPTLPRTFRPIEPPLAEWDIRTSEDEITEGTVLTSKGVNATTISENPLEMEFKSKAREGAVLVLPEGAVREDLLDTHKLYKYVKEYASDWYQFLNDYNDFPTLTPVVNGTLFVVTGTDKTKVYSSALFPFEEDERCRATTFKYMAKSVKDRHWSPAPSVTCSSEGLTNADGEYPSAIFIRGLTVALSKPLWTHGIAPIPLTSLPLYYIPSIPLSGIGSDIIARFTKGPHDNEDDETDPGEAIFHPAILLLQILLDINPDADVAIVDDSLWCSKMEGRSVTVADVVKLVNSIIDACQIETVDGIVQFTENLEESTELSLKEKFQSYILFFFTGTTRTKTQQQALRKLKKLLSKPDPIPPAPPS